MTWIFVGPATGYRAYTDVGSFVDHLVVNEPSRRMDAYVRSSHFYKDRDSKVFVGPLWDFDLTFGVGGFFQNDQIAGWRAPADPAAARQRLVQSAPAGSGLRRQGQIALDESGTPDPTPKIKST